MVDPLVSPAVRAAAGSDARLSALIWLAAAWLTPFFSTTYCGEVGCCSMFSRVPASIPSGAASWAATWGSCAGVISTGSAYTR